MLKVASYMFFLVSLILPDSAFVPPETVFTRPKPLSNVCNPSSITSGNAGEIGKMNLYIP